MYRKNLGLKRKSKSKKGRKSRKSRKSRRMFSKKKSKLTVGGGYGKPHIHDANNPFAGLPWKIETGGNYNLQSNDSINIGGHDPYSGEIGTKDNPFAYLQTGGNPLVNLYRGGETSLANLYNKLEGYPINESPFPENQSGIN